MGICGTNEDIYLASNHHKTTKKQCLQNFKAKLYLFLDYIYNSAAMCILTLYFRDGLL